MSLIRITPFGGMIPKIGSRLLPDSSAAVAKNTKIQSGELRPLRKPSIVSQPNKLLPAVSIYSARNSFDERAWFTWPFDVDVVRAPLSIDTESRFYFTGDGSPKYTTYDQATGLGNNDYPESSYEIGIPNPQTKPAVSASGGTGLANTRFYVYTFYSQLNEETAPSPVSDIMTGRVDDTWAISGMDEFPVNGGVGTAVYSSGFTTFTNSVKHWLRAGDVVVINSAELPVTAIPATASFKVAGDYSTATAWARKSLLNIANMKRRLYRTSGTLAAFQLVADDVGSAYNDNLLDGEILGDELISQGWDMPRVDLQNITVHSSGALVGTSKNLICFSEPLQPHSWPRKYELATDYEVVGISVYGTEVGIATKGNPYIASGVDPESMTLDKKVGVYPCLSKRSVIGIDDGFMYAAPHGMVYIGASGVSVFSEQFYTKDEWQLLNPTSMIASPAYGRIYIAYALDDGRRAMITMESGLLIAEDVETFELYTDIANGELYISDAEGIKSWDSPDEVPLTLNWRSKEYVLAKPENMGAAKVDFEPAISAADLAAMQAAIDAANAKNATVLATGNAHAAINTRPLNYSYLTDSDFVKVPEIKTSNVITFILRKGTDVVVSRTVVNSQAFRLPGGYKSDVFSVEVISQSTIREIRVAQTMAELSKA